jgi:hypothetical protein
MAAKYMPNLKKVSKFEDKSKKQDLIPLLFPYRRK